MRLAIVLGAALLALTPGAVDAQATCTAGAVNNSGYTTYVPTGYTAYTGFASFPGATASGVLPAGYSTNPYGCATSSANAQGAPSTAGVSTDAYGGAASGATYSAVYASNVYNPYSGWGVNNAASYPFASSYAFSGAPRGLGTAYAPASLYSGFASFPGMAPSGYITAGGGASTTSPFSSYGNTGAASTAASPFSSYQGATGASNAASISYPYGTSGTASYYGVGSSASNGSATGTTTNGTAGSYGTPNAYGTTGYGTAAGYSGYGQPGSYSGVSTMITFGCSNGNRC